MRLMVVWSSALWSTPDFTEKIGASPPLGGGVGAWHVFTITLSTCWSKNLQTVFFASD